MKNKKEYILTDAYYSEEKTYKKGDKIKLTDEQAANLVNKVVNKDDLMHELNTESKALEENKKLITRIKTYESEIKSLKKKLDLCKKENIDSL